MDRNFYLGLEARVNAGQYTMAEITAELDKRLGQGRITDEDYAKLLALAEVKIDHNYNGNKMPTNYDLEQDIKISDAELMGLENFELIMTLHDTQTATQRAKMAETFNMIASRSATGDVYVRAIIDGRRTFDQVHVSLKQEVADKLIALGREDLITDPNYLPKPPVEEVDPEFGIEHEV